MACAETAKPATNPKTKNNLFIQLSLYHSLHHPLRATLFLTGVRTLSEGAKNVQSYVFLLVSANKKQPLSMHLFVYKFYCFQIYKFSIS